jgi:RNA polymerase sigma factor (sigma-70 family)
VKSSESGGVLAPAAFATTRWSRVIRAGSSSQPDSQEALANLCGEYWGPLYHFARRKGHPPEDAQDLTQGFILSLLENNGIALANRERGKFRTFLLSAFCNYLANEHRQRTAQKRGGGRAPISWDAECEEGFLQQASDRMTPELQYEKSWALALLDRVMRRLRSEYEKADRLPLYEAIQPYMSGAEGRPGYTRLSAALGMSESAVTVAMHRMRRRYGEFLREEIAHTVTSSEEVEDELRHLMHVVAAAPD